MAVTFLKKEPIANFEIWENTPRLPQHIQTILAELDAEDKLKAVVEHYINEEEILSLCRAMSALGFNPIEPLNGISRNGKIIVFDGIRRLIAAEILLNPELIHDIKFMVKEDNDKPVQAYTLLKQYKDEMSDTLIDSLRDLSVIEFNSRLYTLESASTEVLTNSIDFSEELICPECGRFEFADGEVICPDCECNL